jgi:hypothetical protein
VSTPVPRGRRRLITYATAVVVGLAAVVVAATPAQAACIEYANTPFWDGTVVGNYGGRQGCGDGVNFDVHLRQDIPAWPDKEWGTAWGSGDGDLFVWTLCSYDGSYRRFFIELRVQGRKIRSFTAEYPCRPH